MTSQTWTTCNREHKPSGARCVKDRLHPDATHYGHSHYPGQVVSWVERLDKLGRRIGRNWWREWIMSQYHHAREHWEVQFDLEANCTYRPGIIERHKRKARRGGHTEVTDFVSRNPPPTLRQFLEEHAGMHAREE